MSYPCACSSYGCNCRCFTSRFKDESFVYYKLVWHIPWNKANTVTLFFLEFLNPPPLKWKQSTESFFNRTMLFRFLSYKVFRRMHLSKVQDFAGLQLCWVVRITVLVLPEPCRTTWLCLMVPVSNFLPTRKSFFGKCRTDWREKPLFPGSRSLEVFLERIRSMLMQRLR